MYGPADAADAARAARRRRLGGIAKYVLLQLPELAAVVIVALGARSWWGLPGWAAWGAIGLWIAKDVALYPILRLAYESGAGRGGAYDLVGARGIAQDALDPTGYVRVASELWRAELAPGAGAVARGGRVHVRGVRSLTLVVEPAEETEAREAGGLP